MDHIAGNAGQLPGHGRRTTGRVLLRHQDGVRGGILIGLLRACLVMANATICTFGSIALSPSPFPRISCDKRRSSAISGSPSMIGLVRAVTLCATLAFGLSVAQAADKAFRRDDLADSAIKLEAQIKGEAGPVAKTGASLRTDADAAFRRNDYRTGLSVLAQIAATAPEDAGNWLRLAKVIFQISPKSSSEQTFLLERAST